MNNRQVVVFGVIVVVGCAALVWWLEKFEVGKLHREIGDYLNKYDEFRDYLDQRRAA